MPKFKQNMTEFEEKILRCCTPDDRGIVDCIAELKPKDRVIELKPGNNLVLYMNSDLEAVWPIVEAGKPIVISMSLLKELIKLPVVYIKNSNN